MRGDAPLKIARAVISDAARDRRRLADLLRSYMDARSADRGMTGRIPTRSIFDLVPDAAERPLILQSFFERPRFFGQDDSERVETASLTAREACYLLLLMSTTPAKVIAEFGTFRGDTTLLFALNSPADACVLTTDFAQGSERAAVGIKYRGTAIEAKVRQYYDKTTEWNIGEHAGRVDFVFVDAGHDYASVREDSKKALSLLAPGGVACWHDYRFRWRHDVVRALDEVGRDYALTHLRYTSLVCCRRPANN